MGGGGRRGGGIDVLVQQAVVCEESCSLLTANLLVIGLSV